MEQHHLPSNCYSKRLMKSVDGAVIHFISAKNIDPSDPFNRQIILDIFRRYKVSAKYLIERDGNIVELVPSLYKSYHAGKSIMNGRESCNDFTVGIELVGGTDWPYTDEQMIVLGQLLGQLMTEHQFTLDWVQGHDKIRANWHEKYPDRKASVKVDPGKHFQWEILNDMLYSVSTAVANNNDEY